MELPPLKVMRSSLLAILLSLVFAAGSGACSGEPAQEVVVFAAASLTDVLTVLGDRYEAETGVKVLFNFGASQQLARQIADGAPADLFLPAGRQPVELLTSRRSLSSQPADLLGNELVVVARAGNRLQLGDLTGLTSGSVASISIPEPDLSPAGHYAREAIVSVGLWDALSEKIVPTADVRAALTNVERGNTDVAFVYRTDAMSGDGLVILDIVDAGSHSPIVYPLALVADREREDVARRFASYLASGHAQDEFVRHGFSRPNPPGSGRQD